MIKVEEVFQETLKDSVENPDGSLQIKTRKVYSTRECSINTDYIVTVHPHKFTSSSDLHMLKGQLLKGRLFSKIVLDGNNFRASEMIVVLSFDKLQELLS